MEGQQIVRKLIQSMVAGYKRQLQREHIVEGRLVNVQPFSWSMLTSGLTLCENKGLFSIEREQYEDQTGGEPRLMFLFVSLDSSSLKPQQDRRIEVAMQVGTVGTVGTVVYSRPSTLSRNRPAPKGHLRIIFN
jgi:hypothetical protein